MKNILITGASSGLGAALTEVYASEKTQLFLSGRQEARLQAVAAKAKARGARVHISVLDVTDLSAMKTWIEGVDRISPLDLVIANAGISAGTGEGEETDAQSDAIFATNLYGLLNTVRPAFALMKKRRHGQVAIMASLAGFRGMAGAPSYMASKAAVRVYGEAMRLDCASFNVKVSVICPGFVKTPMTEVNKFHMPFLMEAEKAAQIIKRGLAKNKARISFPWPMTALVWLIASLPASWSDALVSLFPRK